MLFVEVLLLLHVASHNFGAQIYMTAGVSYDAYPSVPGLFPRFSGEIRELVIESFYLP